MQNHRTRVSELGLRIADCGTCKTSRDRQGAGLDRARGLRGPLPDGRGSLESSTSDLRAPIRSPHSAIRNPCGGTAAVELAIVLPVLLLLVFGCVDFGRVAYYSIALKNAVGCGAQYAATHRFTEYSFEAWQKRVRESVTEEVRNIPDFDRDSLNIAISIDENTPASVRVSVGATYPFQTIVDWPGLPKYVPLRHRVTVQQYQ